MHGNANELAAIAAAIDEQRKLEQAVKATERANAQWMKNRKQRRREKAELRRSIRAARRAER